MMEKGRNIWHPTCFFPSPSFYYIHCSEAWHLFQTHTFRSRQALKEHILSFPISHSPPCYMSVFYFINLHILFTSLKLLFFNVLMIPYAFIGLYIHLLALYIHKNIKNTTSRFFTYCGRVWSLLSTISEGVLYFIYWSTPWVLKPWVATYFFVGQRNDNGSHGSPTDLQYIYINKKWKYFWRRFFLEKKFFLIWE